jgi:hypothetical protein
MAYLVFTLPQLWLWTQARVTITMWIIFSPNRRLQHYACFGEVPKLLYILNIYLVTQNTRFVKKLSHEFYHWCQPRGCGCYLGIVVILAISVVMKGPTTCSIVEFDDWMYNTSLILLLNVENCKVMKLKVYNWELHFEIEWKK